VWFYQLFDLFDDDGVEGVVHAGWADDANIAVEAVDFVAADHHA